ncbi:MAG: hypothetical protein ACLGHJ_09040 [Gammaproteobacteria bacterium]
MITKTTRNYLIAAAFGLLPTLALALEMPKQGMSMDEVRAKYGSPERDLGAIGKPAITRWVYDGYTVYFEGRRVVHTVRTQSLHGSATAAPARQPAYEPAYEPAPAAPALSNLREEEAPAPAFAPEPEPAAPAPYVSEPAPALAAPALAPEPVATPAPSTSTSVGGGFRFDPVTGRLIIDSESESAAEPAAEPAPATAPESDAFAAPVQESAPVAEEPAPEEPVAAEPAPAAEPSPFAEPAAEPAAEVAPAPAPASGGTSGSALDDTLEFDPETGTFRPRQ